MDAPAHIWRTYRIPILLGSFSVVGIILSLVLLVKSVQPAAPIQFSRQAGDGNQISSQKDAIAKTDAYVDVEGAVVNPGVIQVPMGSRVEDVLKAAGGLRNDADTEYVVRNINRAMKVVDGMKIYIPSKTDTSHNIDPLLRSGSTSQNTTTVSINMASKEQLESLSGVGPVTAQKIIDNRPYQTLEELVSKKAVGAAVFEKIKFQIML